MSVYGCWLSDSQHRYAVRKNCHAQRGMLADSRRVENRLALRESGGARMRGLRLAIDAQECRSWGRELQRTGSSGYHLSSSYRDRSAVPDLNLSRLASLS